MRTRHFTLAYLAVLTAIGCAEPVRPPVAAGPRGLQPPQTHYNLASAGTAVPVALINGLGADRCMDVAGANRASGTQVQLWTCYGNDAQTFRWMSDGTIRVYEGSETMCLDAYGGAGNDGDAIVIWPCHGGPNQQWTPTGASEIRGINGKCLDVYNANPQNGTHLMLWNCYGNGSQKWGERRIINPGESIQAKVDSFPAGTQFLINNASSVHRRQSVVPKSGDGFYGVPGAVLDGEGATPYAFWQGDSGVRPDSVTISNIKVINYTPVPQRGAINAGSDFKTDARTTTSWVITDCEVSYNGRYGIRIGNNTTVQNCNLHHNTTLGIGGSGDNVVVTGNEIAYNNYQGAAETGDEAGGAKFARCTNLTVSNNFVHHNTGPGLWTDTDNYNVLYYNNRVEDNATEGIVHEVSHLALIRKNQVRRNGFNDPHNRYTYLWNAGIGIHSSPNVQVDSNIVEDNNNGIVAIQQDRSGDYSTHGTYLLQNLSVHDNTVRQTGAPPDRPSVAGGAADDRGSLVIFTSLNNRWTNNTYFLSPLTTPLYNHFAWMGAFRNEVDWQGYGQDVSGTFNH